MWTSVADTRTTYGAGLEFTIALPLRGLQSRTAAPDFRRWILSRPARLHPGGGHETTNRRVHTRVSSDDCVLLCRHLCHPLACISLSLPFVRIN